MRRIAAPPDAMALAAICVTIATLALASPAAAALPRSHGQLLRLTPVRAAVNATQSSNWLGYDQGSLEQGGKLFNSITGDWTVPRATRHASGQAGSSSDWIGIGGGCVDSGCALTDQTLIQTGTEQDVAASGVATYSVWWEEIPSPSVTITTMNVSPGDRMHASIAETIPDLNVWTITIKDLTNGGSYATTVPYASTHATAEWIEENPLILGTSNAGFSTLPALTSPRFDLATVNGTPAKLAASEEMDLVDANGKVIGSASAPDPEADGFNACAWASTCRAPTNQPPTARTANRRHPTVKAHRKRRSRKRRRA